LRSAKENIITEDIKLEKCLDNIKKLYETLENLSFVGFSESYEQYFIENKKAICSSPNIDFELKRMKIDMIE
jgi:hypothetical protein